jgi:choline monooxygenase
VSRLPSLSKPLGDDAASAYTLSADYYLDNEVYELEKQRIFYRSWQYVAHESLLKNPGDYATLRICDESIFVIRSADNRLRAFYNICRHRAHELLAGSGNLRNLIVCPYHAWSYDDQGKLARAPMSDHRPGFDHSEFCLRPVKLEIFCGCVFVNLDPDCASLASIAGDLEADIRSHLPYLDDLQQNPENEQPNAPIKAGWKVIVDNYVECYHCRPAHPDFASIIDMDTYQVDIFDQWSRQYGPDIRDSNSAYPLDPENGFHQSVFWYLWPNTTFNVMPGPESLGVFTVQPVSIDCCNFNGHSLTTDGQVYQPRSDYFNDVLGPEDVGLCESVQRGLRSKSYDQGVYMTNPAHSGESEYALHHFHRLVLASLGAD